MSEMNKEGGVITETRWGRRKRKKKSASGKDGSNGVL